MVLMVLVLFAAAAAADCAWLRFDPLVVAAEEVEAAHASLLLLMLKRLL